MIDGLMKKPNTLFILAVLAHTSGKMGRPVQKLTSQKMCFGLVLAWHAPFLIFVFENQEDLQ